jgi:hypothetical protein
MSMAGVGCTLWKNVTRARSVLLVAAVAVPLAQLGHLVAFGFRVSSTGAHWYFPSAVSVAGALIGAGLVAALALLVLASLVSGAVPRRRPWSFALLFSGLLAAQVTFFLVQEGLEAHTIPGTATLAIGLLSQQPVALVAALALRWLSARLGPALYAIATPRRPQLVVLGSLLAPAIAVSVVALGPARPRLAYGQRAPPL